MSKFLFIFSLSIMFFITNLATAADFPARPITVIIPFDTGGAVDPVMRVVGDYLQKKHGITFVIINKPQGGGAPAMLDVLRARPDGYTIGFPSANVLTVLPQYKNVGFRHNDLSHVCQVITLTMGWAVHKDSGIDSIASLMQKTQNEKGVYSLASPGSFTAQRFFHAKVMRHFPHADFPYVAYDGSGSVVAALLGKHVTVGYMPLVAYIKQKDLRTIAISSAKRDPVLPNAPTFAEILGPEYVYNSACGVVAPPKTPPHILARLEELFAEALQDAEVQKKLANFGATPDFLPGAKFTTVLNDYAAFFAEPIKEAQKAAKNK